MTRRVERIVQWICRCVDAPENALPDKPPGIEWHEVCGVALALLRKAKEKSDEIQ